MELAVKIVAVVVYAAALLSSILKTIKVRNCENEEWYVLAALLMLFFFVYKLTPSVLLRALAEAAFVAYAIYSIVRFSKGRATYELYNAPQAMEEELNALVDSFRKDRSLDASAVELSNKRPYRITVRGLARSDRRVLLSSVAKVIHAHGKVNLGTLVELLFLIVVGGLLYVWLKGICLVNLIR